VKIKASGESKLNDSPGSCILIYNAFTETGATQTMKTNQMAELKQ